MKSTFLRFFVFVLLLFTAAVFALAQEASLKKANAYFDEGDYPNAVQVYKEILEKSNDKEVKRRLADCYRLMKQPVSAEYWYEQIVSQTGVDPINKYYYGLMLKANGKYEEAKAAFTEYTQLAPHDSRGIRQVEACEKSGFFLEDPGLYQISLVNINSKKADFAPAFYKNGIVFASEEYGKSRRIYKRRNAPYLDLFFAEQKGENPALLGIPQALRGDINTQYHESSATFTNSFKAIYFTRNNFYNGKANYSQKAKLQQLNLQIFTATLNVDNGEWGKAVPLPFNNTDYSTGHPSISPDGKTLYFISDMPGGYGGTDLYLCKLNGDKWDRPQNLGPNVNTEGNEMFPFISSDGILYFASDGLPGLGGLDVFATRQQSNGNWAIPENLRYPVNTNSDDFAFIMNPDNGIGYFSSNRPGGQGDDDLYSVVKSSGVNCKVSGLVLNKNTGQPVAGAVVRLINMNVSKETTADANGFYSFDLPAKADFTLYATKDFFFTEVKHLTTRDRDCNNPGQKELNADIMLAGIPVDPKTGQLSEPITIVAGGETSHPDLPLPKINFIYYDLDQYFIREDAKVELDKIVAFMKENPGVVIQLKSHTDSRGTKEYNQTLSTKRAQAAVDYIVSKGVSRNRLTAMGLGETQPVNECTDGVNCPEEKHQQNRRTEFVITGYTIK